MVWVLMNKRFKRVCLAGVAELGLHLRLILLAGPR
jgi:hypothetical protein